jgi:hypothetical protein
VTKANLDNVIAANNNPWTLGCPPHPFNQGVSCRGLPPDQASFLKEEIGEIISEMVS